jgi:hypothetical protein
LLDRIVTALVEEETRCAMERVCGRLPYSASDPGTPSGRSAWQSNAASGVAQPGRLVRALTNRGVTPG